MKMKRIFPLIITLFLLGSTSIAWSQAIVHAVRAAPSTESTRVVLDVSEPVTYEAFVLNNPDRLVIDISNASMATQVAPAMWQSTPVKSLRHSPRNTGTRIVLDLHQPIKTNSFLLAPTNEHGHRLVIDLLSLNAKTVPPAVITQAAITPPVTPTAQPAQKTSAPPAATQTVKTATPPVALPKPLPATPTSAKAITTTATNKAFIVAIDAGHGGEDPGATGSRGTREKHVVMAIARELAAQVNKEPGMKAYLTRDGDYFVPLRTRIDKARTYQADIFISIHADAFRHPSARGASVFTLSENGASSEAALWLAEKENSADLVGGVSLDDKDKVLASILIDLSQTASNEASLALGSAVLNQMRPIAPLHGSKQVQQAGFLVLKSPDIPSILVETEFISNPQAEQKLINKQYQQQVAKGIMQGIRHYHRDHSGYHDQLTVSKKPQPPSYSFAPVSVAQAAPVTQQKAVATSTQAQQYAVSNGDTLSGIATRFGVSVSTIKSYNKLSSDRLYIGQQLKIPSYR